MKRVATFLSFILLIALTACSSRSSNPVESPAAEASGIIDIMLKAASEVDTFKLDAELTNVFTVFIKTSSSEHTPQPAPPVVWKSQRTIDLAGSNMQMSMDIEQEKASAFIFDMYFVDGWRYINTASPRVSGNNSNSWIKNRLTPNTQQEWTSENQITPTIGLFQGFAQASVLTPENKNGIDCLVLDVKPSDAAMANWIVSQGQPAGPSLGPSFGMPTLSGRAAYLKFNRGSSVRAWIAKDSLLPVEIDVAASFSATAAQLGDPPARPGNPGIGDWDQLASEFQGQWIFSNYNQPVSIQLPPGGLNAMEVN